MDDIVVSIKDVSKVYKLYDKPIDRLKESLSITHKSYHQDHFALEGISLDVHKENVLELSEQTVPENLRC